MQIYDILVKMVVLRMPHLILIPGLGDRKWLYRLVCPVWRARGFRVHIFTFVWEGAANDYHKKQSRLNDYIRNLDGDVYLIGASAGGVAALNALAADHHDKIKAVATIATPYTYKQRLKNETLARAIGELSNNLPTIQQKPARITFFYGIYDQVVPPDDSRLNKLCRMKKSNNGKAANVNHQQLPVFAHGLSIAAGLTVFSGRLGRSLR